MEPENQIEESLDLGEWLGRRQAFGLMAQRCSAADAECLAAIHDRKLYLRVEDTWEVFCQKRLGVSRAHADKIVRFYKNLGPGFYKLNSFLPIKPAEYRRIAESVSDCGVTVDGETIAFTVENADRIEAAVQSLRGGEVEPPADPTEQAFARAERSLKAAIAAFQRLRDMPLDDNGRLKLCLVAEGGRDELEKVRLATGL